MMNDDERILFVHPCASMAMAMNSIGVNILEAFSNLKSLLEELKGKMISNENMFSPFFKKKLSFNCFT